MSLPSNSSTWPKKVARGRNRLRQPHLEECSGRTPGRLDGAPGPLLPECSHRLGWHSWAAHCLMPGPSSCPEPSLNQPPLDNWNEITLPPRVSLLLISR